MKPKIGITRNAAIECLAKLWTVFVQLDEMVMRSRRGQLLNLETC